MKVLGLKVFSVSWESSGHLLETKVTVKQRQAVRLATRVYRLKTTPWTAYQDQVRCIREKEVLNNRYRRITTKERSNLRD